MGYTHGKRCGMTSAGPEISFEEVLRATEPVFELPVASMYAPYPWRIGQRVSVENVRAFVNGEKRFDDWSGTGTIDMIQYGGQYVRVVEEPYYAWVGWKNFDRMKLASKLDELLAGMTEKNLHGEVDFGPAVGEEFPNNEPDGGADALVPR